MGCDAHTKWTTGSPICVVIDTARVGLVRGAIHELLHVLLDGTMWPFSEDVEESIVNALEEDIYESLVVENKLEAFSTLVQTRVLTTPRVRPNMPRKSPSSAASKRKVEKTLHEFKAGSLHSGSEKGPLVTDRKQAVAIALSKAKKARSRPSSPGKSY